MVLAQKPNKSFAVAIISFIVYAIGSGVYQTAGLVVFAISLIIWGWQEITTGENWFRKALGYAGIGSLAVLLFIILNRY